MKAIGLDIGTTTVSACVLDAESGKVIKSVTIPHAFLAADHPWEKVQSVQEIELLAEQILTQITQEYDDIVCLGLTGQMHGIIYLDKNGNPVSDLITWQDGRGDLCIDGSDETYAQRLSHISGYACASGFGAVTYYHDLCCGSVDENAVCFCTVHDYLMMRLCGLKTPVTHPSDAASFGLFDLSAGAFDANAIAAAGMDSAMFPAVSSDCVVMSRYGFPVAVAIGDNQACFFGSVRDPKESLLVNVGTGSQISCCADNPVPTQKIEVRPYTDGSFLLSGSPLCGGRAYALLERFFHRFLTAAGYQTDNVYDVLGRLADENDTLTDPLYVRTTFSGTRHDAALRGCVENLGTENFTPEHLTVALLQGCVDELHGFYTQMLPHLGQKPVRLIGSGNGLRKNPTLQRLFSRTFEMELHIPVHMEEAAYGAALFALQFAQPERDLQSIRNLIQYEA